MKLFYVGKDGGELSTVTGYWLIESKRFFSVVLLKFEGKSRPAFHTHAFNCLNWLIKGNLTETIIEPIKGLKEYKPSIIPFIIKREDFHKVDSGGTSWVLSIRGPWSKNWEEFDVASHKYTTLRSGRKTVGGRFKS